MEQNEKFIVDAEKGISMEDMVNELIESETEDNSDSTDTTVTDEKEVDENVTAEEETPEGDSEEDTSDNDVDDEADDEPEDDSDEAEEDESEEEEETEEVGEETEFTFKADGEEVTVSVKDMIKSYGLQKNLTRRGQELSEKEKQIEHEVEVVRYYKETPERQKLIDTIDLMKAAEQRGYAVNADGTPARDENGNIRYLSSEQIKNAPNVIAAQEAKLAKMAKQPMQDEAIKEIPELWSTDSNVKNAAIKKYGDFLMSVGYTQSEMATITPRELLLAKKALAGDETTTRVNKKVASKVKPKKNVVRNVTKSAKGDPSNVNQQRGKTSKKISDAELAAKIEKGDASPIDMFMDLD